MPTDIKDLIKLFRILKHKMKYFFISIIFYFNVFGIEAQTLDCPKPVIIGNPSDSNYQVIFPLGWSEKGNFSYIHQDINVLAGAGDFQYNFIVQNMKTNKILHKKEFYYNSESKYFWKQFSTKIDSLAHKKMAYFDYAFFKTIAWNKNRNQIYDILAKYKIKLSNQVFKNMLNLQEKGITVDEKSNLVNSNNRTVTTDYKITLQSKSKEKKIVYHWYCKEKKCSKNSNLMYMRFIVKGYFESPFKNQIAIIAFKETNGYGELDEFPFAVGANLEN